MTSVSLLVINYRTAALALQAIRTARAATSLPLQVVVVDNSLDNGEAEVLRTEAERVIAAPRNLGYAGGINAGRPSCDGEVIVVSNPDVTFCAGAIDRLVEAGAAVAGPALFWDDACTWMLPPAELHTRAEAIGRTVASRSRALAERRDRRRFSARLAFWSLDRPTGVRALSGAVMAIRTKAFDAAGGFDDRFPLYFEENDFLRRVRGDIVYVPAARCRHLYNQSAGGSSDAAAVYARSELEYLRKWGGAFARRFERSIKPREPEVGSTDGAVITEASPLATFETAAGCYGDRRDVPQDVWRVYRGGVLHMRTLSRSGQVLDAWSRTRIPA